MESSEDMIALSKDNWLLNYVEIGRTLRSPLDSRVRTHMWVFHHFYSEFAKSNRERMRKEREQHEARSYHQDCHGNSPEGGKTERAVAQRIVRNYAKMGRRGGPLRMKENVPGTRTPGEKPNLKSKGHSFDRSYCAEPSPTTRRLLSSPADHPAVGTALKEYSLPVKCVELPDTTGDTSAALPSTHQHSQHRCNSFWSEVFLNSTRYLVLNADMSRVITGGAAQNPRVSGSSLVAGSGNNRKRKRDDRESRDATPSAKRLHK